MRLLQLRFTNINSLAGTWEIDFTNADFRRSPLFAIIGPTGSGKSTILDAVSLALYATTPRMTDTHVKFEGPDACPVMTKGEGAASAAVRFEADGREYLSRWSRRTKRTGRLSEDEVELVAFASPEDRTGRVIASQKRLWESEIQRITRMSFPIFTRSVLLAQGAFSNFLKAADDERANLLEKITGTDLYSAVSMKIFEKNRSARDSLDMAVARLEGMQILSDEDRRALEQTVTELSLKVPAMEKASKELDEALRWRRGLDRLTCDLADRVRVEAAAKAAEAAFEPELRKAERAEQAAKPVERHEELLKAEVLFTRNKSELAEAESQLEAVRTALPDLEATLKTAATAERGAAATRDGFMPEYRRMLEADEGIRRLSHQASTAQKTAEAALEAEKTACADLETAAARQKKAADESARLQERMTTTSADAQLETPLALLKQSAAAIEALSTRLRQEEQNADTLVGRLELGRVKTASFEAEVKAAVEAHAACQTTLEQARKTLAAMQAKSSYEATLLRMKTLTEEMALARHVETLLQQKATIEASTARMAASADPIWWEASGAPEMQGLLHRLEERLDAIEKRHPGLCTVLSTPDNTHLKSLSEERNALDKWTSDLAEGERACRAAELKEREALENKSLSAERFRKAQALLEKLEGELRHTRENRDAASKALEAEKTHAQELRSQLPDSDAELDLPALCTALEARVANRRKLEAQASQAADALTRADRTLAVCQSDAARATQAKNTAEAACGAAKKACTDAVALRAEAFGERNPEAELTAHDRALNEARARLHVAQDALSKAQANEREGTARAETLRKTSADLDAQITEKRTALAKALEDADFETIDEARGAALPAETIRACRTQMQKLVEERVRLSGEVAQLDRQVKEESAKSLTTETAEALAPKAANAATKLLAGRDELSAAKKSMAEDDRRRLEADDARREIERLRELAGQWEQLNMLLGSHDGKKFRAAAQKITFRILLKLANEAMKTMSPRYQLRTGGPSGLSLDVIDHEMGSQVRTSQNLSGGESFMVSLALALGLSRMGGRNLRVDTLFLDEGFGTLDEDTLNKALYALETLQKSSGKLIGIISHVKSIRERIDAQIVVTKRPGSGRSTLSGPGVTKIDAE